MNSGRDSIINGSNYKIKHNTNHNLTEIKIIKNNIENEIIRKEKKKLELYQKKKNLKFQIINNKPNKINNFNKLNYVNYIKNNKPILYDKKINLYMNNILFKKIPNSIKNKKDNLSNGIMGNNMINSKIKPN